MDAAQKAVADAQKDVDAAESALKDAQKKATDAADALSKAQQSASDAQKAYEDALSKLSDAQAKAADAKYQEAEKKYSGLKGRSDAKDAAAKALKEAQAALDQAKANLVAAEAAVPGLGEQAEQYGDVADIIAALPEPSSYLADPQQILDVRDKLVAYGAGNGLTDATKDALARYEKLLADAYRLAMEAKGLGPVIEADQKAADAADSNLAAARASYDLERQISEQLRQAEAARQQRASVRQASAAGEPSSATPRHMADGSAVPDTGDTTDPYLPLGAERQACLPCSQVQACAVAARTRQHILDRMGRHAAGLRAALSVSRHLMIEPDFPRDICGRGMHNLQASRHRFDRGNM